MSKREEMTDVMSRLQGLAGPAEPLPPASEAPLPPPPPLPPAREREVAPRRSDRNRTPRSRLVGRATYDIGRDLKEAIRRESVRLGVPASQLAKYLLLYAWNDYVDERIPEPHLVPSDSPKFRNRIDFEA